MFRSRTSAQKPGDDLLADFRQQFPEVSTVNTEPPAPAIAQITVTADNPILAVPVQDSIHNADTEVFQDLDPTPRASNDPWRFTPSLLDAGAFGFHSFANAAPAFYSSASGSMGAMLPPQTQPLGMTTGLESPLPIPTTDAVQPSIEVADIAGFQALENHQLQSFNAYVHGLPVIVPPTVPIIPSPFVHHDTGYETMEQDGSPMDSEPSEDRMPAISSTLHTQQATGIHIGHTLPSAAESFRFLSTLNAPTAMVRHADEIPITYLNKGQAYSLSIVDTKNASLAMPGAQYRTYVRISFEDEQQRQKPNLCWSLWKEGRGTNEAHHRGGKLQAVEYVDANQPVVEGIDKKPRVELESSSFDGFSVIWTPGMNGAAEVSIAVRFNFLSTDFSHSKGVKGIPVRLCAKTHLLASDQAQTGVDTSPEICFCKVKLFRDHGAERKLSNDVAHVKKSVDKLKQQIDQAENGHKDFKRKRSNGIIKIGDSQRVVKTQRHKRTWSMSSASSASGGPRLSAEEDLHFKLQTLQDMFTSTRPVSVLYLRGEELDDPDLHPVSLSGDSLVIRDLLRDGPNWQARSARSSIADSLVSPSPSSLSLASQASVMGSTAQLHNPDSTGASQGDGQCKIDRPMAIEKAEEDGTLSGWIEALGVDPSYRPVSERSPKPVACFYIINHGETDAGMRGYHRAIYLAKRTLVDLNERIATKWGLDISKISRTTHITKGGIEIEVDDDVVQELREGQDMELQIEEVVDDARMKEEWDMVVDGVEDKHEDAPIPPGAPASPPLSATNSFVLRLIF